MLVSAATPRELAEWFHKEHHGQRLLCLVLAPSMVDQDALANTIQDVCLVDSTIGEEIALFLIDPRADYRLGFRKEHWHLETIPARAFTPIVSGQKPVLHLRYATGLHRNSAEARRKCVRFAQDLALHTARFVPEFIAYFQLVPKSLPCLCLFVRGIPQPTIIPLGKDWDTPSLLALLSQIRSVVDAVPDFSFELFRLAGDIPVALPKAEDLAGRLSKRTARLTQLLDTVLSQHGAEEADVASVAELISKGFPSTAEFDATLERLAVFRSAAFRADKRLVAARKLLVGVLSTRAQLQTLGETYRRVLPELEQRVTQLEENRQRLSVLLQKIQPGTLSMTRVALPDRASAAQRWLEAINLSGDLAEKASTVANFLRRLSGL